MFEGLVRQLILGYLGQYIKDIHREQLKITLWNEEVLLENVELILEAFDYLELPFALKQGRVGRLSIRIPWKKLGWDPIIIILEDILVCASQREDEEWSVDEVEKREFAGKKAKLATAELAKLSQRVCDNQTGKSFTSYITAKIIDGIQVTIRNVHVVYGDISNDKSQTVFGIKLASLTAMKQNYAGVLSGKVRVGQVNKLVEIKGLEIYCKTLHKSSKDLYAENGENSMSMVAVNGQNDEHVHLLSPVDVSASLSVNRSGRLENNAAQYSVDIELSDLVLSLDEDQLQQILYLYDYLCTCRLREKYGRYRPWGIPISERPLGWQKQWWHYAQQSVLSDVRKRMKKTSWKYLGERIGRKRQYVKLYKLKLECLRKEEPLDDEIVTELDQMEKESDIEDILSYRSTAENELQEFLVDSPSSIGSSEVNSIIDKSMDDEATSGKPQGWLKWLSRGMLGAGGTDDSSQFSGVVSDEVIKDIYEATKFHPAPSPVPEVSGSDGVLLTSIKCSLQRISATLRNRKLDCAIGELVFEGNLVECMIWEESAVVTVSINAVEMINPIKKQVILLVKKVISEEDYFEVEKPSLNIQAYIPQADSEGALTLKVLLEPIEVTCDPTYFVNFMDLSAVLGSYQSHEQRVLNSLNGINDVKSRLISKAEYILSLRKRMMWDISLINIKIIVPWENGNPEMHKLVLELTAVTFSSKRDVNSFAPDINVPSQFMKNLIDTDSSSELLEGTQILDLYDLLEVKIIDFQINLVLPFYPYTFPIMEKLNASSALALCIVQDESFLKALEVYVVVGTLLAHMSPSIYGSVLDLIESMNHSSQSDATSATTSSSDTDLNKPNNNFSSISVIANLESAIIIVDLENDLDASCTLTVSLQDMDMRLATIESKSSFWICTRDLQVTSRLLKSGDDLDLINVSHHGLKEELNASPNGCFLIHYDGDLNIWLSNIDLHCYPHIIGLLVDFSDKLSECSSSSNGVNNQDLVKINSNSKSNSNSNNILSSSYFDFQRFSCPNIYDNWESIQVDHYPFVTIYNDKSLLSLESSLINTDWKKVLRKKEGKMDNSKLRAKKEFQKPPGLSVTNLDLSRIKLHLHDSSSIVASFTLSTAKSTFASHESFLDVLFSTEGLSLTSPWYPQTLQDSMWGPATPNLSPVFNIRVRNGNLGTELDFSIQNVSCVLPTEFLAVLIGYFSLPDWTSNSKETPVTNKETDTVGFTYKFEILDSVLYTPVVNADYGFVKLDIPQLYLTFIENSDSDIVLKEIPSDCSVPSEFTTDLIHCLNVFGRDLSLHHLFRKDNASKVTSVSLIDPFSGDIWITMPNGSNATCPTCVMSRINTCQFIVEGVEILGCYEALTNVINQFTSIDNLSTCFTSDMSEFLQSKNSLQENDTLPVPVESSTVAFTEIRCSIQSMSLKLPCLQTNTKFKCAVSLKNNNLLSLDTSFTSLTLSSLLTSIVLLECTSTKTIPVLNIKLLMSEEDKKNHLQFSLPCVNIWLYMSEWSQLVDFLTSFSKQLPNEESEKEKPTSEPISRIDTAENSPQSVTVIPTLPSEDRFLLTVKSDHIGVKIRVPVQVPGEAIKYFGAPQVREQNLYSGRDHGSFLFVYLQSRFTEVDVEGDKVNLKSNFGKVMGTVEVCQNTSVHSWPLFQLLEIDVGVDVGNDEMNHMDLKTDVYCDNLDVWLSHHTFYFCQTMFVFPEDSGSSEFPAGSVNFKFHLRKVSVLLTDQKWSSNGPLLEILMGNLLCHGIITANLIEGSVDSELQVNYNNIHKVLWEPFLEPWKFQVTLRREQGKTALQNSPVMTDVHLDSSMNLNINVTESLIEVAFRTFDMIKDASDLMTLNLHSKTSIPPQINTNENTLANKYAPYTLENLTSLPLVFYISKSSKNTNGFNILRDGKYVQPGASYPVYIDNNPDEQTFRFKPSYSTDSLVDKQFTDSQHHYIIFQLEGTSTLSTPVSIDLVGVSYFEVDFSNSVDNSKSVTSGYVVPVVIDVSVQRYTKLVRLYSTVILTNSTSVPFEVRFDIPFGVSPKILDPIHPGHEFPLPLHLAESGRIRWRPLGNTYLWSEAYSISNILSNEGKIGHLRSFVCYPSLPSSDPFRCCVSVHDICLPPSGKINKIENNTDLNKRCIHFVTLINPLIVKNYLPVSVSVMIESGGVSRTMLLSEVETSFYHIDSSHDLLLTFDIKGFKPSVMKFPRAEKFSEVAKFSGTKFSSSESVNFISEVSRSPLYVTMEKVMDAFSGARELSIFVPFLLYNCCGFPLMVANSNNGMMTSDCTLPSCYDLDEEDPFLGKKDGLGLLSSSQVLNNGTMMLNNNLVSTRKESFGSNKKNIQEKTVVSNSQQVDFDEKSRKKVNFRMYSPDPNIPASEITVRVSRHRSEADVATWSTQFFLVPPTGSTTVLVPRSSTNASYVISVNSSAISGPYSGKTRIINFQPRYVISNACSKDLCYRQKGSDFIYHLKVGQHCHVHWTDVTRELLVSVRFDEPGWQWSGCFFPEHLGDTQLKMRNYVTGAVSMVRVEVQNADDAIRDDKIVGNPHGDSGTNLILLSDDDTGFMPYRIDNFSKERLRIYQQKCEAFETVIHSYTSCPYAWDEPSYPHRLTIEVFAERVVGSYTLDDAKEYKPVVLPATSEKPERRLLISVHAEGAIKVLSIIDSSYHIFDDIKLRSPRLTDKREYDQKQETSVLYKEKLSVSIPFIGISVMSSQPQELLFACARNTMIDLVQSLDQQKFSLKIFALQIDNQLPTTPYPVILSFDHEYKQILPSQTKTKDASREPVFSLAAAKWRNKDRALLSFEHINLRMTDFHLELEQDVILSLFDFFKRVSSRYHSRSMPHMDSALHPLSSNFSVNNKTSKNPETQKTDGDSESFPLLPSIVPIGAPWQKIYLLARKQKKIYVELLEVAPITLTLSFSSSPWMLRNGKLTSGEFLIHRGLMALADVEGARIHLRRLTISHQLASLESIREILIIHYTRQLLHEMYKVFGSAGVIGNPMGFARSVGVGIKDFLSVPARSFMQSPAGLMTGMAQGTTSLLSNTVYAISDAATQVSRAAHKGIVAFTMDDPSLSETERLQKGTSSHGKGVINEVLEGLTGLLQSPIRGAEKHGLPGVLSGIALGVTGLVARPAASILEVTEKTARSIRNRSKLYHMGSQRLRIRLPRPLTPLKPYSWEDAIGISILSDSENALTDETLLLSKSLKHGGKFVIITEKLLIIVTSESLKNLGEPDFKGVPADSDWVIEAEIGLDSVIHVDVDGEVVHIVGSSSDVVVRGNVKMEGKQERWNNAGRPLPLFQTNLECGGKEEAGEVLKVLMVTIEKGKERGWGGVYRLHQSNVR